MARLRLLFGTLEVHRLGGSKDNELMGCLTMHWRYKDDANALQIQRWELANFADFCVRTHFAWNSISGQQQLIRRHSRISRNMRLG